MAIMATLPGARNRRRRTVIEHFRNHQWAVNQDALFAVEPGATSPYHISGGALLSLEDQGGRQYYSWPLQLARKTWIDIDAFIEAYQVALTHLRGRYYGEINARIMDESIDEARNIVYRRQSRED